jgi:NAD(P)-dependent dehydrogenase (short-subunit alcohol dehydrogenase family)
MGTFGRGIAMSDNRRFTGAVALVTGGASGIGRAIAERIAREGADVAVLDINEKSAEAVAAGIRACRRKSVAIAVDITDDVAVAKAVGQAVDALGPIGVLVSNAGGVTGETFQDTDPAIWRADIELNLNGAFFVTRATMPSMLGRRGGAIVNVAAVNSPHVNLRTGLQRRQGRSSSVHPSAGSRIWPKRHPRQCSGAGFDPHSHLG